jgi:hypothetical protein
VHEVAFAADQVSVELAPFATVLGLALRATVGTGNATDTVADCDARRPAKSSQVNVYVEVAVIGAVVCEPLTPLLPLHPPEATHEWVLLLFHASVAALPDLTVLGVAWMVTVGAAPVTVTVAD